MVRTRAFQACNQGSTPCGVTIAEFGDQQSSLKGEFCVILATFWSVTVTFMKSFLIKKSKSVMIMSDVATRLAVLGEGNTREDAQD